MKRSKPLRRRAPLAQGDKPLKRTPLARGTKEMRRTPLKRAGLRTRARAWGKLDREAHAAWERRVTRGKRCAVCKHKGREHDADRTHDPHHILPARYIRKYVRSLKLPADDAKALLLSLLWDVRNGMCLDRSCHQRHENAFAPVPRALIPKKAWQFAEELGLTWVLDRLYP